MIPFFVDTETYGTLDIRRGTDVYMTGAECMIVTFAREERPVGCWDVTSGAPMPAEFEDNMLDERVTKVAHNVPFDRTMLRTAFDFDAPAEQWHCTMSRAYAHGLPGSLDALGPILGVADDMLKLVEGKKLIQLFCKTAKGKTRATSKTHPEEWQKFLDYATQDTATLREIYKRLPSHNYVGEHFDLWCADQEINERGFFIDQALCHAAVGLRDGMKATNDAEVAELTDGRITAGTQRERIQREVVGEYGLMMLDLQKDTIVRMLQDKSLDPDLRRLLELRLNSSLTSLTKYERALERVGPDGRMRHTLQYAGASRTGRWAGRGVQPHNMPRPKRDSDEIVDGIVPAILDGTLPQKYADVNEACQDALRSMIVAEPGNEFVVGDWSNIEGRCVAWEADENWKLAAFAANDAGEGEDLYKILYGKLFNVPAETVDGKSRQKGKAFELAFGYGGGVGACVTAAGTYGVDLDELAQVATTNATPEIYKKADKNWKRAFIRGEDFMLEPEVYIGCDISKQVYRKANSKITQLWWDVERAIKWAIERPGSVQFAAKCKIWCTPGWLIIELPSTRRLLYAQPKIRHTVEYDEETEDMQKRTSISYMHASAKQWRRTYTYGGKIVENITQAIANDVLRKALLRARADGWPIILHVHDELVAEILAGMFELSDLLELMERSLWWSEGLPLKAAGYTAQRYKKD